jgi:imidazolonepropionase-like amidohydrolase
MTSRIVFSGGRVWDGLADGPVVADVAVEDGRIEAIGPGLSVDGSERVDLAGRLLIPGLIDCHSHVAIGTLRGTDDAALVTATYLAFEAARNLRATLDAGFTTVRDAAFADSGLRNAVADGLVEGPRLLVSLVQMSPSAGPYDHRTPSGYTGSIPTPGIPDPVADGPDGVRAKVRELVHSGADVIKVFATGHFSMARDGARRSLYTGDELRAITDEAARQGVRVMAHAHGADGAAAAARAGVASIEHGFYLDDDALAQMALAGVVLVPTLLASAGMVEDADDAGRPAAESLAAAHRAVVTRARELGVEVALGTDCPMRPHGRNGEELGLLVQAGMAPVEAFRAATSVAARLLGLEHEVGAIRPGLAADLLVIEGEELATDGLAERIVAVYRSGRHVGPSTRLRSA